MARRIVLTVSVFLYTTVMFGQSEPGIMPPDHFDTSGVALIDQNELTIYVIPSTVKYDWSSPRTLFKSYFKNFKRGLIKKDNYLLGHAFVELNNTKSKERILTGMRSASKKESKKLVLKQHYGLGILGADLPGKLETAADLDKKVTKFSRKGQLAFMTFFINDETAERLKLFFQSYKDGIDSNKAQGARYGGAFWPRFTGEGAGCSAYAVSFLDLAGLLKEEFDEWLVKINIPMDLIGGPYNSNQKVRLSDIKKHKSWACSEGSDTLAYEYFEIYDPTLMYEWIQGIWNEQGLCEDLSATPSQFNQAKGILIDSRDIPLPAEESIFMERETPSIFIDYFHQMNSSGN